MSPADTLRVMLVEDHAAFRQALAFALSCEPELEVVAQAGTLAETREALDGGGLDVGLDVAVLDLALPDGDGTDPIGELHLRRPGISVPVLSTTIWPGRLGELLGAGADAVLDKVQSPTKIAREARRLGGSG
jgi:DNA-binding NarL/FixJ family response regulator